MNQVTELKIYPRVGNRTSPVYNKNKVTVNFEDAGKKTVDGSVIELEKI